MVKEEGGVLDIYSAAAHTQSVGKDQIPLGLERTTPRYRLVTPECGKTGSLVCPAEAGQTRDPRAPTLTLVGGVKAVAQEVVQLDQSGRNHRFRTFLRRRGPTWLEGQP